MDGWMDGWMEIDNLCWGLEHKKGLSNLIHFKLSCLQYDCTLFSFSPDRLRIKKAPKKFFFKNHKMLTLTFDCLIPETRMHWVQWKSVFILYAPDVAISLHIGLTDISSVSLSLPFLQSVSPVLPIFKMRNHYILDANMSAFYQVTIELNYFFFFFLWEAFFRVQIWLICKHFGQLYYRFWL